MRHLLGALLLALAACGTIPQDPGTPWVPAPPAPAPQPPAPPVPPPPQPPVPAPPQPPAQPGTVEGALGSIAINSTLLDVKGSLGEPALAPDAAGGPSVGRWYVVEDGTRWLIWVVFEAGRVTRKGASKVVEVR